MPELALTVDGGGVIESGRYDLECRRILNIGWDEGILPSTIAKLAVEIVTKTPKNIRCSRLDNDGELVTRSNGCTRRLV